MRTYDKTPNVWKRDMDTNLLIPDEWSDDLIRDLSGTFWTATEKLDGTSMRVGLYDGGFFVRGRTDRATPPVQLLQHCLSLKQRIVAAFLDGHDVCLYGEGVGKGIQKDGHLYGDEQRFIMFDALIGGWWLTRESLGELGEELGIPVAPVVPGDMRLSDATLAWMVDGADSHLFDGPCEGWVLRPRHDLLRRDRSPIRVKIKERDFARLRHT